MVPNLFPFESVRSGQDRLLEDVGEAVRSGKNLIAHAPSGLGKTSASLSPSLDLALKKDKTVFFLTPKHSQHKMAVDTANKIMERHDVELTVADIIGKRWLCSADGIRDMSSSDFQNYCKTLKEEERCTYYNNTFKDISSLSDEAVKKLSELKGRALHAEEVKRKAKKFCTYEILVNHAKQSDLIIGDYFHLFHPGVREAFLAKVDKSLEDAIVVVDEAHNLPSRTRGLLSKKLSTYQISRAQKEAEEFGYLEERRILEDLEDILVELGREVDGREKKITKEDLVDRINEVEDYETLKDRLERIARDVYEEEDRSYCSSLKDFLGAWLGQEEGFVRFIRKRKSRNDNVYYTCHYKCLDPQLSTREVFEEVRSSILMSATMTPMKMYSDLLGLKEGRTRMKTYSSPFPKENRSYLVVDSVTTKYKERSEEEFDKIAWFLSKSLEKVPGNASAFFPSYDLRDEVKDRIDTDKRILLEKRNMSKEDKSGLLNLFREQNNCFLLGISGASFAEGVDFPERCMDAVFVVGLPLKEPDLEAQALIDFYEYKFGRGWDYAYLYPAMEKALQAAGRCIRTKKDRGVVVFMDKRYTWNNYRKVFPPEVKVETSQAPWNELKDFFSSQ
ncbi:MAG: ATP-dependent DNA helicase [Candidatus Aenigmatarchaeota archaeon]